MKIKKNINALSVTIVVFIVAMLICAVLFTLYYEYGLFGGAVHENISYTIEFTVKNPDNAKFDTGKELYLTNSREYFGKVKSVTYDENNEMVISIEASGFYRDNFFLLNGNTTIDQGSEMSIMNNSILIQITNIY